MSPTILLLCIDYSAATVPQSNDYDGFKIEHHCFKVLFADDTVVYLNENSFQFKCVFDFSEYFGKKSGCKVNLIKYLGVYIPVNKFDELSLFEKNFAKLQSTLNL